MQTLKEDVPTVDIRKAEWMSHRLDSSKSRRGLFTDCKLVRGGVGLINQQADNIQQYISCMCNEQSTA